MKLRYVNLWEALFPSDLRRAILRHFAGLVGTGILIAAAGFGLALASWSSADPSLNHASGLSPENWLGSTGAIFADLAMQTFGLGAVAFVTVLAAWGWRLASGRPVRHPLRRGAATLIALALAGGFASSLAAPSSWPLISGLGGMFGDMVFASVRWPLIALTDVRTTTPASVVLAIMALATAWYASAIGMEPLPADEPEPRQRRKSGKDDSRPARAIAPPLPARLALGTASLVAGGAQMTFRLLTGWTRKQEESRLKIAMARADEAAEDGFDWQPSGAGTRIHRSDGPRYDDDDGFDGDFESDGPYRDAQASPGMFARLADYGATAIKRLWEPDAEAQRVHDGARVEPSLFGAEDTLDWRPAGQPDSGEELDDDDGWAEDDDGKDDDIGFDGGSHAPAAAAPAKKKKRRKRVASNTGFNHGDPDAENQLPPLTLLNKPSAKSTGSKLSDEVLAENARQLEGVLEDFGVRGEIINVRPGPVVTLYELEPAPGIKSSRVIGLADDIARSMSAISARVAVVPGRNAIGIELPNETRETVFLYDLVAADEYTGSKQTLAMGLGKNIGGEPMITDLARMPHLLVAGTTGSGKSVGINAMILSILFRLTPDQCKLIMIDPKMLELSVYDGIPHLLSPVVTEPGKAVVALKWAVREMEDRYKKMSKLGVRNIDGFNKRVRDADAKGEVLSRTVQTGFDKETGQAVYETEEMDLSPLPYIVIVVDEMADLMMVAGKDIEGAIQRLAQMARAAGLHLIMATQRPSVDVITGTIKANFPTRISFQVTSKIDSRTILGEQGAEQLLGQGDMLYMAGGGRIGRVHGAFVSDEEVESVVQFLKRQGVPEYLEAVTTDFEGGGGDGDGGFDPFSGGGNGGSESDQLYDQAVAIVARDRKASTSYIQRRLSIGYNRAATIIERMENEGVVSPANHAGKREILAPEPSFEDG